MPRRDGLCLMNFKNYIIKKSKDLNIDLIGFTDCSSLDGKVGYIIERKKRGIETEFEVESIEKRVNPKLLLPNCKTIISIGISYNVGFNEKPDFKLKGRLSMSSWGKDYHYVLKEKMERLIEEIKKIKNFDYRYFVDTGPLIDREIAYKSGIGYYGKNCSIINEKYGSFIFIGYILTNLDIDIDYIKVDEGCGECDLCLRACPTGALEGPYRLNPKKCISYLTQTKEKIPYELRSKMGIKIYGCDTCQMVCPKNKNIVKGKSKEFVPQNTKGYIDIEEILKLSNRQFKEKYGSMAGSWRGKNILKRNGIIALGNMKQKEHIDVLKYLLKEESSHMIKESAAWAILNIDYDIGSKIIKRVLKDEKDKKLRKELINLLKYYRKKI